MIDQQPAPGYYWSPARPGTQQWWDGERWVDDFVVPRDEQSVAPPRDCDGAPTRQLHERIAREIGKLVGAIGFVIGVVIVLGAVAVVVGGGSTGTEESSPATPDDGAVPPQPTGPAMFDTAGGSVAIGPVSHETVREWLAAFNPGLETVVTDMGRIGSSATSTATARARVADLCYGLEGSFMALVSVMPPSQAVADALLAYVREGIAAAVDCYEGIDGGDTSRVEAGTARVEAASALLVELTAVIEAET